MEIIRTSLDGVVELRPTRHGDHRGWLIESYNAESFARLGLATSWPQDNESLSAEPGTIRGIHWQANPRPQAKLIRVTQGAILDVAVDLRRTSPTFGHHTMAILSAADRNQLLIPIGFGHGFCTLEPNTVVTYKLSDHFDAALDRGIRADDQTIGIDWPVDLSSATLSEKDRNGPTLSEATDLFE